MISYGMWIRKEIEQIWRVCKSNKSTFTDTNVFEQHKQQIGLQQKLRNALPLAQVSPIVWDFCFRIVTYHIQEVDEHNYHMSTNRDQRRHAVILSRMLQ